MKIAIEAYARRLGAGRQLTDEMFTDALVGLEEPPLRRADMMILLGELDTSRNRQTGRPPGGTASRRRVAAALVAAAPSSIPPMVLEALVKRLETGRRFTEQQRNQKMAPQRHCEQRKDRMMIRGMYRELLDAPRPPNPVVREVMGSVEIPEGRSTDTVLLDVVEQVMREQLDRSPPSIGTMRNLVVGITRKNSRPIS